ncbi:MAG: hypothetical protein HZB23_06315 [Deltaproteobacteria bacterium]|nr:hypothetical protein [Deltaproteobacteria bacterium]
MKKLLVIAAMLLLLAPVSAMAGMTTASELELEDVTGQVGMTIDMSMNVVATDVAWGDSDGFGTYTTAGWLRLRNVTLPTISINGLVVDQGTGAGVSYIALATTGNLITGSLTIESVVVGSTATATTESLGELRVGGIGVSFGTIRISGHANP